MSPITGARRRVVVVRSGSRAAVALALMGSLLAVGLVTAVPPSALPAAEAVPGVPEDPEVIYSEDFENRPASTPVVRLNQYTAVNGQAYTADPAWLTLCNGWVAQWNQPTTSANGAATQVSDCLGQQSWNSTQQLAQALGVFNGQTNAVARDNFAVSAYTAGNPGAPRVEFQTATNIALPTATGRYLTAQLDVAAVNCPPIATAPTLQFQLVNNAGTATQIGGTINACTAPDARPVAVEARGLAAARADVRVGTTSSNGSILWNSPTLGLRILNTNGSGAGNDHGFDNIRIVDATPVLDKEFVPATVGVGQPTTLRFTITNTSELASKNGWSFTDNLPAGMVVASPAAASSTCGAPQVTATPGAGTIAIQGNLVAGSASCTVSVSVVAADTGSYANSAANVQPLVGLDPPAADPPATLTVVDTDFGDAPASYGTPATSHTLTTGLTLGPARDAEGAAFASPTADGDDTDRTDDEDAVTGTVGLRPDQAMTLPVDVRNTSGAGATAVGWVDFNADGDFADPGERSALVPVPPGAAAASLTWPTTTGVTPGASFVRLRLYPGTPADPQPTGAVTGGEVEDHPAILQVPAVEVDKTAGAVDDLDGNGIDAGDTITYSFVVTNTGNVPLDPVAVEDPLLGGAVPCGTGPLAAGATRTCPDVSYPLSQSDLDAGVRANTATVTATPPSGPAVTDTDDTSTDLDGAGALSIDKTATLVDGDADGLADVGETVDYSFTVTNTGSVTLTDVAVDDPTAGPVSCTPTTLAPGDSAQCVAAVGHTVTQDEADSGSINNTATATGTTPTGDDVTSPPDSTTVAADQSPSLAIDKTATLTDADGDDLADVGESIAYSFTVTNTGTVTLTGVTVDDALAGPVTCALDTLTPGASTSCTAEAPYVVTQADLYAGSVDNTATAAGTPPTGPAVDSPPDTTSTATAPPAPSLSIDKFADFADPDGNGDVDLGEEISYSFRVTNTGNVTLGDVGVDDDLAGPVTCAELTLAPGASTRCTADAPYVVTQDDVDDGQVVNTATATGTPPQGPDVTSPPDSTTTPGDADPEIEIVKTATVAPASGQTALHAGDVITYGFTVTNTGNVTLDDVTVDDPAVGAVTCTDTTLPPGAETTCTATATRTVTQDEFDDGAPVSNTATVTATAPDGTPVDGDDTVAIPVAAPAPALTIAKTATPVDTDGDGTLEIGEQIEFSFVVTNTGDVTVDDVAVDDPTAGPVTCTPTSLAPTEEADCTATAYTITQDDVDAGEVVNTATATGGPVRGPDVTSPPDSTRTAIDAAPAMEVVKTATVSPASHQDAAEAGDTIAYTFTVTNTGPLTLTDVTVSDPTLGAVTCPPGPLAPGDDVECTAAATRTVTQADVDAGTPLTNSATASGATLGGTRAGDDDTAEVPVAAAAGAVELAKTATLDDANGNAAADVGETIAYSFTVTNSGNVTLTGVTVDDPALGTVTCPPGPLAPGADVECATGATRTVTQADVDSGAPLTNTATATAATPSGDPVTDGDTATTDVAGAVPELEMTKLGTLADGDADGELDLGESIAYSFLVENTGNVTVDNLAIADPMLGAVTCPVTTLAPGGSTTCTADEVYDVTQADVDAGQVTNTATASGSPRRGILAPVVDSVDVPADVAPAIALSKTATLNDADDDGVADAGETIAYDFVVTNTGSVTLDDVAVDDPALGAVTCAPTTLAPGQQAACTADATRRVTQADVDAGTALTNTATATGTPPGGGPAVTDEDTAAVPITDADPGLEIVKTGDLQGDDDVLDVGDTIAYTFAVTNTGNVTIDDLVVNDRKLARSGDDITCETTTLAPGERTTCTADYTVTAADADAERVRNTATVTGQTPPGSPVTSVPDTETTQGDPPTDVGGNNGGDNGEDDAGGDSSGDDAGGGLPDTGGPALGLGVVALLALLAGAVLIGRSRRTRQSRGPS